MSKWLSGEYQALVFEDAQVIVGYLLFRREPDHVYLRQLFVTPSHRRLGIGRMAIRWISTNVLGESDRLRIDVLIGNDGARAFWRSVGFSDYCLTMEMEKQR